MHSAHHPFWSCKRQAGRPMTWVDQAGADGCYCTVNITNHLCNLWDDLVVINRLNQVCDIVCICYMLIWPHLYFNLCLTVSIVYSAFVVLSLDIFGLFDHVRQVFSNCICVLRVFLFSGKPIFSVDIHPDGTKFATGGQGEKLNPLTYIFLLSFG